MDYSVLMAVYAKEQPAYLQAAIDSMLRQTVPPAQFVVVCDGKGNIVYRHNGYTDGAEEELINKVRELTK